MRIQVANIYTRAANTEAPFALPKNCKWYTMQCRTAVAVRIAFESGHVASSEPPYYTMKSGAVLKEDDLDIPRGQPMYFAAASAVTIEVMMGVEEEVSAG